MLDDLGCCDRGAAALHAWSELDLLGDAVKVDGVARDNADHEVGFARGGVRLDDFRDGCECGVDRVDLLLEHRQRDEREEGAPGRFGEH